MTLGRGWGWDVLLFSQFPGPWGTIRALRLLLGTLLILASNGQGKEAMGGSWG